MKPIECEYNNKTVILIEIVHEVFGIIIMQNNKFSRVHIELLTVTDRGYKSIIDRIL